MLTCSPNLEIFAVRVLKEINIVTTQKTGSSLGRILHKISCSPENVLWKLILGAMDLCGF